jgi:hypothetical protein
MGRCETVRNLIELCFSKYAQASFTGSKHFTLAQQLGTNIDGSCKENGQ